MMVICIRNYSIKMCHFLEDCFSKELFAEFVVVGVKKVFEGYLRAFKGVLVVVEGEKVKKRIETDTV